MIGKRTWRARLLLVLAATVATVGLAEAALRVFGIATESVPIRFPNPEPLSPDTLPDPDVFWLMRSRGGSDPVTAHGFRGEEFTPARVPEDLRVLCVGDSCTYGWDVRLPEAYGMALDRRLQARFPARCVETVLAAAPGWSTFQDLKFVRRHAPGLAADVTIVFVGVWNDMLPAAPLRDSAWAPEIERLEHHPFWSLRIGRLLWRSVHPLPTAAEMKAKFESARDHGVVFQRRVDIDQMRSNVREIVGWARANGPVVAVIPSTRIAVIGPWSADYRRALLETYRELGLPCVDSDAAFEAYVERHAGDRLRVEDCISDDRIHPTAPGHAAIADALEPLVAGLVGVRGGDGSDIAPPTVMSVEPGSLTPGHAAKLLMRGRGFSGAGAPRRIFVNEYSAPFRVAGDSTAEVDLAPELVCRPGPLAITLRTRAGVHVVAKPPVVLPWTPSFTVSEAGGKRTIRVTLDTANALAMMGWVSPELLAEPVQTRWGPLRLRDPDASHPDSVSRGAMTLDGLTLPHVAFLRIKPGTGPAVAEATLPDGFAAPPASLHAQILLRWGLLSEDAWLSDVIPVGR